jgi:hypothetical protein
MDDRVAMMTVAKEIDHDGNATRMQVPFAVSGIVQLAP